MRLAGGADRRRHAGTMRTGRAVTVGAGGGVCTVTAREEVFSWCTARGPGRIQATAFRQQDSGNRAQATGLRHQTRPRSLRLRASGGISTNSVSGAGKSRLISLRAVHASCHGRRDTASARSARRLGEHGPRRPHHRHVPSSRTTWRSRMRRALSHNRRSTTSAGQSALSRSSPFKSLSPTGWKSDPPGSSIDPCGWLHRQKYELYT
jgi:hypothetical protein